MRFFISILLPALAFGGWSEVRTGPFQVIYDTNDKDARVTLNYLEQLRNAIGTAVGQPELPSVWPIRVVLQKAKSQRYPQLKFGRDAWMCSLDQMTPETATSVVDVLLRSWSGHVPPNIRRGLLTLYSTLDVDGTRVTLGQAPAAKDRDWARAHMLAVQPEFSGRLRVLVANLGKGVDPPVAYKNAFEMTAEQIERTLDKYIEAGQYGTTPVSGKPINAQRQFLPKVIDEKAGALALADLAFANGGEPKYEIAEGQGLVALRKGDKDSAAKLLEGSTTAFALVEYAKLLLPNLRKPVLEKAAAANPQWAEPYRLIAAIENQPAQKLAALRKATQIDPQDASGWVSLARVQESSKQMAEAAKSWASAERTTDDPNERDNIRQFREAGARARAEADMVAREEQRRKSEQEMQDLKNRALMDIRKAEAKANEGKPKMDVEKLPKYEDAEKELKTKKVTGVLVRVDCQGTQAVLHVQHGGSVSKLVVADPATIEIQGGERAFSCGAQRPARKVEVEYESGAVLKVSRIEFR